MFGKTERDENKRVDEKTTPTTTKKALKQSKAKRSNRATASTSEEEAGSSSTKRKPPSLDFVVEQPQNVDNGVRKRDRKVRFSEELEMFDASDSERVDLRRQLSSADNTTDDDEPLLAPISRPAYLTDEEAQAANAPCAAGIAEISRRNAHRAHEQISVQDVREPLPDHLVHLNTDNANAIAPICKIPCKSNHPLF